MIAIYNWVMKYDLLMRITRFVFYHTRYKLEDISIATIYGNGKTNGVAIISGRRISEGI